MSALETPPGLDAITSKLKAHRALLIGGGVLIVLGVLIFNLVQSSAENERYAPWRVITGDQSKLPWERSSAELEEAASKADDSVAAGIAKYWAALNAYNEAEDAEGRRAAADELAAFVAEHGEHPLMNTPFPSGDPARGAQPPGIVQAVRIRALEDAGSKNPKPTQNPARPSGTNKLSVTTDEGSFTISLYPDLSPESCRTLRRHLDLLRGSFIVKASEGRYVELGTDVEGNSIEIEDVDAHPPYEDNGLSLFKGVVTFRQAPFTDGPYDVALKVWLEDSFTQDGQYTVLGEVTAGLDTLENMAALEKDSTVAGNLGEPVELQELVLELPDLPAEADDESDSSEDAGGDDSGDEDGGSEDG